MEGYIASMETSKASTEDYNAFIKTLMEVVETSTEAWKLPWNRWKLPGRHESFLESFDNFHVVEDFMAASVEGI